MTMQMHEVLISLVPSDENTFELWYATHSMK